MKRRAPTSEEKTAAEDAEREWSARQEWSRFYAENELPPFNPEAACPKCGWDRVITKHHAGHTPSVNYPGSCADPERFTRTCERCQFSWAERVPLENREHRECWRVGNDCTLRVGHAGDHRPKTSS